MNDSSGKPPKPIVAWLVTLVVLGVMVLMAVNRAQVEERKPSDVGHPAHTQVTGLGWL